MSLKSPNTNSQSFRPSLPHRPRSSWPSTTSAFFASPFASQRTPSSPSLSAGFQFHHSIAEEPEPITEPSFDFKPTFSIRTISNLTRPLIPQPTPSLSNAPDRLDRLLAELDADLFSSPSSIESTPLLPDLLSSDQQETVDHPWDSPLVLMSGKSHQRSSCECANCALSLRFATGMSSEGSGSGCSGEENWPALKVRFCEGETEKVFTWSVF